jgi:hypothetical protein
MEGILRETLAETRAAIPSRERLANRFRRFQSRRISLPLDASVNESCRAHHPPSLAYEFTASYGEMARECFCPP